MLGLDICIPTYKRSTYLNGLLASLELQIVDFDGRVRIYISDNASPDDTEDVVARFRDRGLPIEYIRRDVTSSANENIAYVVGRGSGDFLWCIGDDDIVAPGAICRILKYIDNGFSYVVLNVKKFEGDKPDKLSRPWFMIDSDIVFESRMMALRKMSVHPGFISAVIAKREILATQDGSEEFIKYGWNQLYNFYIGLANCQVQRGVLTSRSEVYACSSNPCAYDWQMYFLEGLPLLIDRIAQRDNEYRKVARPAKEAILKWYVFRWLLHQRRTGGRIDDSIKIIRRMFKGCYGLVLVITIACIPQLFIGFLYWVRRKKPSRRA